MNKKKKFGKGNSGPLHRGRIQAQGATLEESVPWSGERAPTGSEGKNMLARLTNIISSREASLRTVAFKDAGLFIDEAVNAGGVYAEKKKTFMVRNTRSERVDVEIRKGYAFKVVGDL
ncbi:hypothetical protein ACNQ05_09540 [Enterobacter cloacae complex sp.6701062]|uniref:hypothetical protein n=1 Tax=Enterobacter cloacae complex TaxID=354276 RepID=UPI0007C76357|nr:MULTISPECIES: hypothetical protein [Enterobacter cloacae complex]MCG0494158.1 hypothetical protein [Enterobacter hormaechei]MCG0534810.1 hypothetical protein [Enterobacter hormaechei]MCG0549040.1 hypothetical protein [Enterobacter hormaechei]MCG0553597.1 hypothetical protein [Enterobacter hormaechei]MCG0566402.1 hypothetical protein [Enterobacter hormaechei]